ncbi:hydroxyproline-rich glycoprotein family protein [Actinidia rufa]|uniref:Hydroxyproline-rich glycoprotein family protein n=1 Tax=Actinidia rufa TaxID=165716 RepID=A0A7J0HDK6_9ERIC|nr:hydroxyproline-rich glycoprotein family protein [Actinidia rufa]
MTSLGIKGCAPLRGNFVRSVDDCDALLGKLSSLPSVHILLDPAKGTTRSSILGLVSDHALSGMRHRGAAGTMPRCQYMQNTADMEDMRDCYDSLLSTAAATANSAYEFSESLREMGACLLEKTALNDDEESGKVLLMLGKLQFELQKLVDNYRSHIFRTITVPSESLLNELRTVENILYVYGIRAFIIVTVEVVFPSLLMQEMKQQCDEKRSLYEYMIKRQREKGRSRRSRGETFSSQQVQAAHNDYDEEATLFVFRLKSLKEGQSRSLLTQAARHHAAQLCFFRKGLKTLEAVEPHVKLVTEQQHIDYKFSGLEDDDDDSGDSQDEDNDDSDYNVQDDGELSFDYGQNDGGQHVSTRAMELDSVESVDLTFPQVAAVDAAKRKLAKNPGGDSFSFIRDLKASSQSAPLSAEKKFDPAERFRHLQPLSSRKFHSYVLPTPGETKSPVSTGPDTQVTRTRYTSLSGPLEQIKYAKTPANQKFSEPIVPSQQSVLRESNNNTKSTSIPPPPLAEKLPSQNQDQHATYAKKIKRHAFSGPLTGKSWSNKPISSVSGPIPSTGPSILFSGPLLRSGMPRPSSSSKLSPNTSPTFTSSPKISELHELPRPPANLPSSKLSARPLNQIGYSGQLLPKSQEKPVANKLASRAASPLPTPPPTLPRSFSIPSRDQRVTISHVSTPLGEPQTSNMVEAIASPPLTPIFLPSTQPASTAS